MQLASANLKVKWRVGGGSGGGLISRSMITYDGDGNDDDDEDKYYDFICARWVQIV